MNPQLVGAPPVALAPGLRGSAWSGATGEDPWSTTDPSAPARAGSPSDLAS